MTAQNHVVLYWTALLAAILTVVSLILKSPGELIITFALATGLIGLYGFAMQHENFALRNGVLAALGADAVILCILLVH